MGKLETAAEATEDAVRVSLAGVKEGAQIGIEKMGDAEKAVAGKIETAKNAAKTAERVIEKAKSQSRFEWKELVRDIAAKVSVSVGDCLHVVDEIGESLIGVWTKK